MVLILKNKHRNRARTLFIQWKKNNPQFFKNKHIKKDLYKDAIESLVSYFRINELSLIDCKIELSTDPIRWTYISIYASAMVSYACGLFMPDVQDMSIWQMIIAPIALFCASFLLGYFLSITIGKNYLEEPHFLQIALERYVELYIDESKAKSDLVELSNNQLVKIPTNAEFIYSERMKLLKYYQNTFIITVNNNGQKFDYVVYSNSESCSTANFIRLCKEQIGKNWNGIDKQQIVITKAPVISGT